MIIEEETRRDVEGDEDVDGVVLVGGEDEEDGEHVHDPRRNVDVVQLLGDVCKRESLK